AKITARALNGRKLTITVNVVKNAVPLKTIRLKKAPNSLNVGKARLLSVKTTPYQATNLNVTFSSSNRNIVSVDKAGKITAKKKGQAKITVRVNGKKSAKMITVK
ncbi:MAG: Ig-like domain-containing protein, partial [Clostridiales Family XIII bacterium]|nr:Ig-like domain-containing protein [Clostridiales Family XIII bacterium]